MTCHTLALGSMTLVTVHSPLKGVTKMQDRVGAKVPTDEQIAGWVSAINKLQQEMAPFGVGLTPDERRHTLRFRLGGEPIVQLLAAGVKKHDVALPGISAEGMLADLQLLQRMKPVRDAAESLFQFTDDTILEASAECWYAATAYYTALSRMVSTFPDIKSTIAEVSSFFSRRRQRSQPVPAPSPTTSAQH